MQQIIKKVNMLGGDVDAMVADWMLRCECRSQKWEQMKVRGEFKRTKWLEKSCKHSTREKSVVFTGMSSYDCLIKYFFFKNAICVVSVVTAYVKCFKLVN